MFLVILSFFSHFEAEEDLDISLSDLLLLLLYEGVYGPAVVTSSYPDELVGLSRYFLSASLIETTFVVTL